MMGWGFERPLALLLLLGVVPLWLNYWRGGRRSFDYPRARLFVDGKRVNRQWLQPLAVLLLPILLVCALAGPYHGNREIEEIHEGRYFLLIADVSGSVDQYLSDIFFLTDELLKKYPEDGADLTLFATTAMTIAPVSSETLKLYVSPNGRFYSEAQDLIDGLGGSTNVERALWSAFYSAMIRTEIMTEAEGGKFHQILTNETAVTAQRKLTELVDGRTFDGSVAVMVTDLSHNKNDFEPPILLHVMKTMGIRFFIIDVTRQSDNNPLGRQVAEFAEEVWRLEGSEAQVRRGLEDAFREIDTITKAPLFVREHFIRDTRVPHTAAIALVVLLVTVGLFLGRGYSKLPL